MHFKFKIKTLHFPFSSTDSCRRLFMFLLISIITTSGFSQAFNLDQGENGGKPAKKPISAIDYPVPPTPVHWVNANLGGSNAHFMEGYSVPYRATLTGLIANTDYVIRIGFDIRVGGKYALDYITGPRNYFDHDFFNHLEPEGELVEPLNNPAVTGVPTSLNTFDIPEIEYGGDGENTTLKNSFSALNGFNSNEKKKLALYGGTITDAIYQTVTNVNLFDFTALEGILLVRFTTGDNTKAVLAWGGHIASLVDWPGQSASDINGSPYHMRIKGFGLDPGDNSNDQVSNGGNTDRSLKTDAVIICTVNGGTIAASQTICVGDNPVAFTSTTLGTGNGTISYKWQKNSSSCAASETWADISGATSTTFDEGVLNTPGVTYYRRLTTSTGDLTCSSPSNCITITVNNIPSAPSVTYNAPACDQTTFSVTVNSPTNGATYTIKDKCGASITGVKVGGTTITNDSYTTSSTTSFDFTNIPAGKGYKITVTTGGCTSLPATCGTCAAAATITKSAPETYTVQLDAEPTVTAAPNPFDDRVRFSLESAISGHGSLELYNILGQKIKTVFQGYFEQGKIQTIEYRVPRYEHSSLIYVFRVGNKKATGKLIGLK